MIMLHLHHIIIKITLLTTPQDTTIHVIITDTFLQDLEGIRLYIGISPTGIRIYQAGDMVRMNSFNWAKVLQVNRMRDFYLGF